MANIIKLRQSSTTTSVPTAGQLEVGELAYNSADHKLWIKDNAGTVRELPTTAVSELNDLSDVNYTAQDNTMLVYNSGTGEFEESYVSAGQYLTYSAALEIANPRGTNSLRLRNTSDANYLMDFQWDNAGVGFFRIIPTVAGSLQTDDAIWYTNSTSWKFVTMPKVGNFDLPIMPAGGTTGQILQKTNATDYQTSWTDAPSGGATVFDDLTDVDLTGAANNDLLFRSGGNWVDTAGQLTWNGSLFSLAGNLTLTKTGAQGDAVLTIEADSNNLNDNSNPILQFYQDGQAIGFHIGISGLADNDPKNNTFTGAENNSVCLHFDTYTSATDHIHIGSRGAVALTIDNSNDVVITNQLLASGGSAAAPGISFLGDPSTGLYRSAADNIDISVGGSLMMNISNAASAGLAQWTGAVFTVDRNANASSAIHVGETATLRGDSQDSYIRLYGEQTAAINYGAWTFNGANMSFSSSTAASVQFGTHTVDLSQGGTLRVRDSGSTDFADFSHDGTNFNTDFTNTANWNLNSLTELRLNGSSLSVRDSGATDSADFSHDGTSFNTDFTNTANWNLNSLTELRLNGSSLRVRTGGHLIINTDDDAATAFTIAPPGTTGGNTLITATGIIEFDDATQFDAAVDINSTLDVSGVLTSTGGVDITASGLEITQSGSHIILNANAVAAGRNVFQVNNWDNVSAYEFMFRMLTTAETGDAAALQFQTHNGTSWSTRITFDGDAATNREQLLFPQGFTAGAQSDFDSSLHMITAARLHIWDSSDTDDVEIYHNGSNLIINAVAGTTSNVAVTNIAGAFQLQDGCELRTFDSTDTDYVGIDHSGTNGRIYCVGGDLDIGVSGTAAVTLRYANVEVFRTVDEDANTKGTGADIRHADQSFYPVGMNVSVVKSNPGSFSAAATWLDYSGHTIIKTNTTAFTATTPGSTDSVIPNGVLYNFLNVGGANDITIAAGSGVTLTWQDGAGGQTGSRTIADGGVATLWKRSDTNWYIWGNGIS